MHFAAAVLAGLATLSSTANAFLIPPTISLPEITQVKEKAESELSSLFNLPTAWHVDLDCPGCAWGGFKDENGVRKQWTHGIPSVIELDIDADTRNGLLINNVAAVLPHFGRPQAISLIATQRRTDTGDRTPSMPIDFVLERLQPIRAAEDAHKMVIPVKFTVVGFGGKPVKVDTVSIDILQTEQVMKVMRVETVPFRSTPGAESCNGQSAWSYCRVKAIVSSRVRQTVAAMSQGGSRAKAWCGRKSAHGTHGPHRGHRGHHRSRARHWVKTLHSSLRFFVIPALLGVIGGLLASAVGMLVGQAVSYLWARTSRRRAGCRHCEAVDIVVYEDEKDGLLYCDEELPLPPPRYEDVESGLRADEKH